MFKKLAVVVTLVATVAAHATFQELWINGVDQGNSCVRLPLSNSPVTSVTSTVRPHSPIPFPHLIDRTDILFGQDIACNVNPTSSQGICQVMREHHPFVYRECDSAHRCESAAGDEVTVEMHQQPNDRSCANEAIGGDHYGPVQVGLPRCGAQLVRKLKLTHRGP